MTTPTHPLAKRLQEAQAILLAADAMFAPGDAAQIKSLRALLLSPAANDELASADLYTKKKVDEAHATYVPVLERVKNKLTQLRPGYIGTMGMSLDTDLKEVERALKLAREGAK